MGHRFADIVFTDSVRQVQEEQGSRGQYAGWEGREDVHHLLGPNEAHFIAARDSFYMATVTETGWPYLQHRGGPAGFVRVIDEKTIGFADFSGNRQYVSVGNLKQDNRVALFFMDYANRTRLKLLGRVRFIGPEDPTLLARLETPDYRARVERGFIIEVEAFDWNCPQHITPRFTETQIRSLTEELMTENRRLRQEQPVDRPSALGHGPIELTVTGVRQLTPDIRAYELRDPAGKPLPEIEAGSHLEVPVELDTGETVLRAYSISSDPGQPEVYDIAVLREEEGSGGSQAVHDRFGLNLKLRCEAPRNDFPLHRDDRPAVLGRAPN
ncbi:MAG: pyridoxamine 5'-phosphate oxidase family protein [Verrucomicrobiota bacterium]